MFGAFGRLPGGTTGWAGLALKFARSSRTDVMGNAKRRVVPLHDQVCRHKMCEKCLSKLKENKGKMSGWKTKHNT